MKIILLNLCLVVFFARQSKSQVNVTGEIKSNDGQCVPFANVLFLQPEDSLLVLGGITNEDGKFILNVQPAAYLLNISMLGYKPFFSSVEIEPSQKHVSLLPISLSEDMQELGEVMVNGKRPVFEKEADRTIINVQNSITSAGNTALEVLEKSPGVLVNRQNGSIVLNGKAGVLVMINNKVNRLPLDAVVQMLDGMSAANIGKIELITNPPAKFDAEGNAGIIHIVMKDNPEMGTNGGFGLTLGRNKAETLGGNFNLNHRSKKLNSFLNYSVNYDHTGHLSYMERYRSDNGFIQSDIDSSIRNPYVTIQNLNAGIEFILTEKTLLLATVTGYLRNWDVEDIGWNFFYPVNDKPLITETFKKELNIWKSGSVGIGLKHDFNERHYINLMFDYLYYYNN
ncbi:MAG: TonB-dependent receptor, partial [Bacteroidales bacterium]|nr:TonB-dependent receptor [Bacteroidales bacterium]